MSSITDNNKSNIINVIKTPLFPTHDFYSTPYISQKVNSHVSRHTYTFFKHTPNNKLSHNSSIHTVKKRYILVKTRQLKVEMIAWSATLA